MVGDRCRGRRYPIFLAFAKLSLLLTMLTLNGCGLPVYFGVKEARAAGVNVPPRAPPPAFGDPAAASPAPAEGGGVRPTTSGSVVFIPRTPQPAAPDEIVGVTLEHDGRMEPRPVSFGQIFSVGRVPRGETAIARADGRDIPTQIDVKTTNPDGSARMAVVTVLAPAPAEIMLVRRETPAPATAVDLARLVGYDLTVALAFQGEGAKPPVSFDLAVLLAGALGANQVSYWLRGPLVTEGRIEVPVTGSMRLTVDIRAYADGSVMTDVQFNNDIAMQPVGGKLVYDVTIVQGGKTVLRQEGLQHFQYQTWHREVWNRPPPDVNVVHDVAALARAGAVHNYDLGTGVSAKALNAQTHRLRGPGFGILGNADIAKNMGMTGGRPDIGPVTLANSIWLMTQHRDAARYALAQADAAGSIPWHYFDSETGAYLTVTRHPKLWADYRGGKWDTKGLTQPQVEEHGWSPDGAHQPDLSYVPYILTGLRYRLDQLHAQAAGTLIGLWPASRQDDKAIVTSRIEQVRGRAWVLRGVNESSFVCPDGLVLCPYFHASVANSVQYLRQEAVQMTKGETFGWFRYDKAYPPGAGETAPWQQDFLANTLTLLALQGVPGAKEVLLWQTNFLAGRFLAESRGFHPNSATAYQLVMFRDTADDPFLTWREVHERSLASGSVRDGSAWSNDDWAYVKMAKAALAGIVSATGSPAALQALDWMNLNAPHVGLDDQLNAPGSNIVPLVPGGRLPGGR